MSGTIKLKRGLDIRLVGEAEKILTDISFPKSVAIKPADFHSLKPKMLVREGDRVLSGSPLFCDKYNESVIYSSPASGIVKAIVRGEKRKIEMVVIECDPEQKFVNHIPFNLERMSSEEVKTTLLENGLFPFIKQRPLDIVANPNNEPKAIFISAFDSAPLASDLDFILHGRSDDFQAGLDALAKLTSGKVHLSLNGKLRSDDVFANAKNVEIHSFSGKHPVGNVGTQIHHIDAVNKGEFVWTLNAQDVSIIGRFFNTGNFDARKIIAVTGSEATHPKYYSTVIGSNLSSILTGNIKTQNQVRIISGNPLTGVQVDADGYLGFYHNQLTLLPEGNELKFVLTTGWFGPGFDKFSNSRLFPTFLMPNKKYRLDTNTNGEERAFVVTGELERVFPFDILPMQLVKAAITNDIDGMENLGIYEVAPEDFALCEYVCTSKINIQDEIRKALDVIAEECM
jgi:Na+-transporting NADH:ubiquinone oxidoreductase subunit A